MTSAFFDKAIPRADPTRPRTHPDDQLTFTQKDARADRIERARARAKKAQQ